MAINTSNLIMSHADVYVGELDAADPTTGPISEVDYTHVGGTLDGVTVNHEPEFQDLVIDQVFGAVGTRQIGREITVETILAELTLENIQTAFGGGTITTAVGSRTFDPPTTPGVPNYKKIIVRGTGVNGLPCTVIIHQALPVGSAEFAWKKDEQTGLSVQWKAFEPGDKAPIRIIQETAA